MEPNDVVHQALEFSIGKWKTPCLVKRLPPIAPPWACTHLAASPFNLPLRKAVFSVNPKRSQLPLCSVSASTQWHGSEFIQGLLLRLLPGLKQELEYLAWEELQVGQQLPVGTAAEENEAKTRRREKRRKAGELRDGGKKFHVAEGDEELWEVFAEFCGRDGYISSSELRSALLKLGLPCTPDYLRTLMSELDVDHDSKVDWPDFRAFMSMRNMGIEKAFKAFDKNGDGVISMDELEQALKQAGIPANDETIRRMMSRMDVDASRTIDLKEFKRFATFLPVHLGEATADPSLYAAWWRTTSMAPSATDTTILPKSGASLQQQRPNTYMQANPFNLQNFFTVFDIVVRTSLAVSLLVVVAGFNEERL